MARHQHEIERDIVAELGERRAEGLKTGACSRVCGVLYRRGSDWDKAFEHIADHFTAIPGKPTNAIFHKKFRDKEALRRLLLRAATGPSEVHLTKLKVDGDHFGKPAVEIVRRFGEPVGAEPTHNCLRIFIDFQGNLITAYPGSLLE